MAGEKKSASSQVLGLMLNGLGKAAGQGAKWAIGKGLNAAFGWENKDTRARNWAKETLEDIQGELREIQAQNDRISQQLEEIEDLIVQVSLDEYYLDEVRKFGDLGQKINSQFKLFKKIINASDPASVQGDVRELIWNKKDIRNTVGKMENLLCPGEEVDLKYRNLLEAWTDRCIQQMNSDSGNPLQWYKTLEEKLREFFSPLLEGYILLINIEYHQANLEDLETGQIFNPERIDDDNFPYNPIYQTIDRILYSFEECTERLVLASYRPDKYPEEIEDTSIPFCDNASLQTIFQRCHLFKWLVMSFASKNPDPGLYYKWFTRPSCLVDGGGKKITPDSNLPASTGSLVKIKESYRNGTHLTHWYKCMDFGDEGMDDHKIRTLRSFGKSNIQTVRYHWDIPEGKYKAGQSFFGDTKLQYFDAISLLPVPNQDVTTDPETGLPARAVLMASKTNASDILFNVFMTIPPGDKKEDAGWDYDDSKMTKKKKDYSAFSHIKSHHRFDTKLPYYGETEATTDSGGEHERYSLLTLRVANSEKGDNLSPLMVFNSNYSTWLAELKEGEYSEKMHFDTYFKVEHEGGKKTPEDYSKKVVHELDETTSAVTYLAPDQLKCPLVFSPGGEIVFKWKLNFHSKKGKVNGPYYDGTKGQVANAPHDGNPFHVHRKVKAKWNIEYFRLAWSPSKMNTI